MAQSLKFLVIRLSSIGDIVHALPAVSALGRTFPGAEIHWVVEARYAALLAGNPFVGRVLTLDTLGWRRNMVSFKSLRGLVQGIRELREERYQAAIDFQGLYKSALIARVSRSQRRLGFAKPWLREPAAGVFYHERATPRGSHVIEMNLSLVERLGARVPGTADWEFPLPQTGKDDQYVEQQLALFDARDFVVINPGAGWKAKRWTPEEYGELIHRLATSREEKIFLTGSPEEEGLIKKILSLGGTPRAQYFPSNLTQFIALVRCARLFVGGDTGPMHLAAAAGTPIVAIFGGDLMNTPERNGPFRAEDIIVSGSREGSTTGKGKNSSYVSGITVESIIAAIHERLARAHG